jgi:hypothetical protein
MSSASVVDEKVAGIQLAVFELIWPTFEWIDTIFLKVDAKTCFVHLEAVQLPTESEQTDCARLVGEIFDSVLEGTPLHLKVTHEKQAPTGQGYREIMSESIFKMIAEDVAPWRLEIGR